MRTFYWATCIPTEHVLQVTVEGLDAHASAVCQIKMSFCSVKL